MQGHNALERWKTAMQSSPRRYRRSLWEVMPELGDSVFFNARGGKEACIISTDAVMPTMRTNCGWVPRSEGKGKRRQWFYRPRIQDADTIQRTAFLNTHQLAQVGGFSQDFHWPQSRSLVAKIIGNSVAPPTAAAVMIALLQAQVVDGK
jgi:site-specific DNA-cytosine methylase